QLDGLPEHLLRLVEPRLSHEGESEVVRELADVGRRPDRPAEVELREIQSSAGRVIRSALHARDELQLVLRNEPGLDVLGRSNAAAEIQERGNRRCKKSLP